MEETDNKNLGYNTSLQYSLFNFLKNLKSIEGKYDHNIWFSTIISTKSLFPSTLGNFPASSPEYVNNNDCSLIDNKNEPSLRKRTKQLEITT